MNKKAIMSISLVLNLAFIAFFAFMIYQRGGLSYIYGKVSGSLNEERQVVMSNYHGQRKSLFETKDISEEGIVFVGDSITDNNEWHEKFQGKVYNRAIGGDTTLGVLDIMNEIVKYRPSKIFIMSGINDLNQNYKKEDVLENYKKIILQISNESPQTKIYIHSILPVNLDLASPTVITNKDFNINDIEWINREIKGLQDSFNFIFIDLYSIFANENNELKKEYTNDGVHLTGNGYELWEDLIEEYVNK